jgi:hypothetical protein
MVLLCVSWNCVEELKRICFENKPDNEFLTCDYNGQNCVSIEQNSSVGRRFAAYSCIRRENTFLLNATWTWTNFIARWMTWVPWLCILWLYRDCSTDERIVGETKRGTLRFAVNRMLYNITDYGTVEWNLWTTILKGGLEDYKLILQL